MGLSVLINVVYFKSATDRTITVHFGRSYVCDSFRLLKTAKRS